MKVGAPETVSKARSVTFPETESASLLTSRVPFRTTLDVSSVDMELTEMGSCTGMVAVKASWSKHPKVGSTVSQAFLLSAQTR